MQFVWPLLSMACWIAAGWFFHDAYLSRRARQEPLVYVWPLWKDMPPSEQQQECDAFAQHAYDLREGSDIQRRNAQWHSSLGKEFPPCGKN